MLMFTIIAPFAICFGAVYRVGDASGWHPMFNYTKWASSNKFHVGDTIRKLFNDLHLLLCLFFNGFDLQVLNIMPSFTM